MTRPSSTAENLTASTAVDLNLASLLRTFNSLTKFPYSSVENGGNSEVTQKMRTFQTGFDLNLVHAGYLKVVHSDIRQCATLLLNRGATTSFIGVFTSPTSDQNGASYVLSESILTPAPTLFVVAQP